MSTLTALSNLPTSRSSERQATSSHSPSLLSYILPNAQGQGPISSAIRIATKLRHQSWIPRIVTDYFVREIGGGRKREDELTRKAIKVIDLLQHAAELGYTEALYTLAYISLVCFFLIEVPTQLLTIISHSYPQILISLQTRRSASNHSHSMLKKLAMQRHKQL